MRSASSTNQFGLSRSIPSAIKREVRQRCAFGCISCGASIYEYDHFDPPFSEALTHASAGIVLLCPQCHALKTKGVLSAERIAELNRDPAAKRNGHSQIFLPHFKSVPSLVLGGGALIQNTPIPVRVYDRPLVSFLPPEDGSDVVRVNALITDETGKRIVQIIDNEWRICSGIWDFEWVGKRMTVRDEQGITCFQLYIEPPKLIAIDRLTATIGGYRIQISQSELQVNGMLMTGCVMSNCAVGIQLGAPMRRAA